VLVEIYHITLSIVKKLGNISFMQTNKGTYSRALCQKNDGFVKIKQRPIKMGGRTIYRTLSLKGTPFQNEFDRWTHLWKVPTRRWIGHTHPLWLWGHILFKISLRNQVTTMTPHKRSPTFPSKYSILFFEFPFWTQISWSFLTSLFNMCCINHVWYVRDWTVISNIKARGLCYYNSQGFGTAKAYS
jgi:hypothetical protein